MSSRRSTMSAPARTRYDEAESDVGTVFSRPEDIAEARDLSLNQEIDLLGLLVATEENMPSTASGQAAELLRGVRLLLAQMGAAEHEPAAVNKAGG
jgi:hypothetical protein